MSSEYLLNMAVIVVISYLLGSIPTAYIVGRMQNVNIFEHGSGNMGATNVNRVLGARWGMFVLFVDMLKAIFAIVIAQQIKSPSASFEAATSVASIAVVIGHNWSLFASIITGSIRGGKGAATAFGTLLMVAPIQIWLGMVIIGAIIITRTRYVSLAVLTMISIAAVWMTVLISQEALTSDLLAYIWILVALIMWRFRDNIQRLLTGTERRLGEPAV
jgi:glycerol-3-phosphate acyltransferase PlsY